MPDLVIVGAGPAGVSAALWAGSQGLEARLLEGGPRPGGQLHYVHFHPRDLAGFAVGDGPALARVFERQLADAGVDARYGTKAVGLEGGDRSSPPVVSTADGERHRGAGLLIACGVRRRRLEVPGERELEGRGVSYSATRDRTGFAGRDVLVVGGGDSAYENALLLAEVGCRVAIAVRDVPRARAEFRGRVGAEPLIEVLEGVSVRRVLGDGGVRSVVLEGPGGEVEREVVGVVIKIGMMPNTEWCRGALEHDAQGFLRVDGSFRTSHPRVWAVGDVIRPPLPSLAVSIGSAALAVAAIRAEVRAPRP